LAEFILIKMPIRPLGIMWNINLKYKKKLGKSHFYHKKKKKKKKKNKKILKKKKKKKKKKNIKFGKLFLVKFRKNIKNIFN